MSTQINKIIPGTFKNLFSLEELVLTYNKLEHLDRGVFSGLINVNYIHLKENKLQYLHPDTFLGLPKLKEVDLSVNRLLQVPTDRNFINSPSLAQLDLSQCIVSSVSVETFANVSALEKLVLRYNKLRTLDINLMRALPKLSELDLLGNPLHCDCQLKEVWRWCEDHNIETEYAYCDTPSEVAGMWWGVLEKGECLDDNIQYNGDYRNTTYSPKSITNQIKNDTEINTDTKQEELDSRSLRQYQVPVYAVPFLFGTIANVILLTIIIFNKDMRTVPNMYILNLAISDIIYLTVLFSEACGHRISNTWLEDDFVCMLLPFCRRLSVGLSAYSVAVLNIQRYRVTVYPLHAHESSQATWRVTVTTIFGVWIVAALFAIPSALSKHLCDDFTIIRSVTYYQRVVIFELLVSCVLPLCVIAFTSIMTARHLAQDSSHLSVRAKNPKLNKRRTTAKIVLGLTVVFLISYVPYHAFWTYINVNRQVTFFSEKITDNLIYSNNELLFTYQISTCFLLINSCLNPVALFCTSSPFRNHLKRYLTYFCKTNTSSTDLGLTRRN
jgi:hypothetical protein